MSPERVASVVRWWVRCYTRNLPSDVAERRVLELDADLHDHIDHERAAGGSDHRLAREVAGRALRGLTADLAWRHHELTTYAARKEPNRMSRRSAAIIAAVTTVILLIPVIGMAAGTGTDWGVFDFVLAALLIVGTGAAIERVRRRPPTVAPRIILAAVGGTAIVAGEADDAPGLVGFGLLLILVVAAVTGRTLLRPSARR